MLHVTYVHHSAFLVETASHLLLFDYFDRELPRLDPDKPLFVFASHRHPDHFSLAVFGLAHPDVTYVFSKDIRKKYNARFFLNNGVTEAQLAKVHFLAPGEQAVIGDISVTTLRSTDEGVAFLVESDGRTLYHGGDLHLWLWDSDTPAEQKAMEAAFTGEIDKLCGRHIDAAFLPLDPRLDEGTYWRGFDYFMRHTDTAAAWPMHCWENTAILPRFLEEPCSAPYRDRVHQIFREMSKKC